MANKNLFKSLIGALAPATDTTNAHGAPAYAFEPRHALAQVAATGCLSDVYYANAETQLQDVLKLVETVPAEFTAKCAVYARERGYMKDMPALLCAALAAKAPVQLPGTFARVIDSPRMLRNFVQIVRSGQTGRKSLGSRPKRLVQQWLDARSDEALFRAALGESPSLADVVKLVHPRPKDQTREAFYGWLLGQSYDAAALPETVRAWEAFKAAPATQPVPDVPFQYLSSLPLDTAAWTQIARRCSWQTLRLNLNTFQRHGVFKSAAVVKELAQRLRDPHEVRRARVFPYQLLAAYKHASPDLPAALRAALQDALDAALANVPAITGKVYVFPDVSGSMGSAVTGVRKGATSAVRCVDVAALVAAAVLSRCPEAEVLPFENDVVNCRLNPRDSVLTNAEKLAALGGGGTNCSAPLVQLNRRRAAGDLILYVSDNQSWVDTVVQQGKPTATMVAWQAFKARSPQARMVCIDLQPYTQAQAKPGPDVLHVGGFSDTVFDLLAAVAAGHAGADYWLRQIEAVDLQAAVPQESV